MKETNFIEQNKQKWLEFEEERKRNTKNPSKLSKLFVQITGDLSFARTFFKNRQVRYLLNAMSQQLFVSIYKNNRMKWSDISTFWTTTLPLTVYRVRRELLLSFVIFVMAMAIGAFSSANDPGFVRSILSDQYIEMTLENIKNGKPMGVYESMSEVDMMFSITLNNIFVSIITFAMGVFGSFGSVVAMVRNGVMVGAFQEFFMERGLFWESFLTIWQHGTLEISSIIIAGGAGIVLGKGLLFPGTYTRAQAFRISGRRGLTVLAGILPIIVFAAFIESFFTRYTDLPDVVRLSVIIGSLAVIIFYFVVYPIKVARANAGVLEAKEDIEYKPFTPFDTAEVHSGGKLFETVLMFFTRNFGSLFKWILIFSALFTAIFGVLYYVILKVDSYPEIPSLLFLYREDENWLLFALNCALQSLVLMLFFYTVYRLVCNKPLTKPKVFPFFTRSFLPSLIAVVLLNLILKIDITGFRWILYFVSFPYLVCFAFYSQHEQSLSVSTFFKMLKGEHLKLFGLMYKFLAIGILFSILIETEMFDYLLSALFWNLYFDETNMDIFLHLFTVFLSSVFLFTTLCQTAISAGIFTFNIKEKYTAEGLKSEIELLGIRRKIIGFERE